MGSPFPGVDPFLEGQGAFRDFHVAFNVCLREKILRCLPENYLARIEEHVYLDDGSGTAISRKVPDVEIERVRGDETEPSAAPRGEAAAAERVAVLTLDPVVVPNKFTDPVRVRYIEIRTGEDDQVVTVIETLSPTNKSGSGRNEFLSKRLALMYEDVNLVELDLLLRGRRIEMAKPMPPGDFYAMISRGDRRPDCEVYPWRLDQPLPKIPIPLKVPDADIMIDLQDAFETTFARGPYDRLVRYNRPLGMPLPDGQWAWVDERLRSRQA